MTANDKPVFRIDRFIVPAAAHDAFLERTRAIRDFLAPLEGCRQSILLEEPGENGTTNVLTIAEWRDDAAFESARAAAAERYRQIGFDPRSFITAHGVIAEFGAYGLID